VRIIQVDALVFVNIATKVSPCRRASQEGGITAIEAIEPHPGKVDPLLASVVIISNAKSCLTLEVAVFGGYAGGLQRSGPPSTAPQKQPFINQRGIGSTAQRREDAHLQFSTLPN